MTTKRRNLTELLIVPDVPPEPPKVEPAPPAPAPVEPEPPAPETEAGAVDAPAAPTRPARKASPRRESAPAPARTPLPPEPEPAGPKYLRLERKEARLWAQQYDELDALARRINRYARRIPEGDHERITANTLIRVAVTLLLEQQKDLAGVNEEELVRSLRSRVADSRSH